MRRATGHIQTLGRDHYAVKISLGKDAVTGKYRSKWVTVRGSRVEAENKLAELKRLHNIGALTGSGRMTVSEYLNRWLADYVNSRLTPKAADRYASLCRVHLIPALGKHQLTQLTPGHIQSVYAAKLKGGLSPRSIRYLHVILHKALQTALKWGMVGRNAAAGLDLPKARPAEMQTWNEGEISAFLTAAKGTQYYPLFYLALFTGARRGELLALRWQDVDFIYSQISINRGLHQINKRFIYSQPKTAKSRRTIALPPSAFLVLEGWRKAKEVEAGMLGTTLKDSDLVFNSLGKPWRPNTVTRAWHNLAVKAGVKPIRFHDARHTHASLMLKQGVHPKVVQERLGHANIAITLDTYSHVTPGLQEAAAKRFDDIVKVGHNS